MNYYKRLFPSKIWSRGDIYYRSGRVSKFKMEDGNYLCTVSGSDHYEVMFEIFDHRIIDMYCDCPYAEDGNYCKHMAAAVMKLDADGFIRHDGRIGKPKVAKNEWEKLVFAYQEKDFVTIQDSNRLDRTLSQKLIDLQVSITKNQSKENVKNVLKELTIALKAFSYLEEYFKPKATLAALGLVIQVIKDIDKNALTIWARKQINYAKRNDIYNILIPIAFTYDEEGLAALDKQIESLDKGKDIVAISQCLSNKINMLENLNYTPEEICDSLKDYSTYEVVMNYKLNYFMSIHDYERAEKILQSLLIISELSYQEKQEIEDRIAELYVKMKNKEKYKKYILRKVKEIRSVKELNYLETLKSMYDNEKEWKIDLRKFADVLKEKTPYYILLDLYKNAKEYGIMFELLYSRYDLDTILKYKDLLIQYYKPLFLHVVYQLMKEQLDNSYTRDNYYDVIDNIQELKKDANCSVLVQDILIYAKENHGRKKLLMDMLENIYDENQGGLI